MHSDESDGCGLAVRDTLILLTATLFAAVLRMYQLGDQNFWLDEMLTLAVSSSPLGDLIDQSFSLTSIPPLFYLPQFGLVRMGLTDHFGFRVPAVIYGILSVLAIYLLARELCGRKTGMAAAVLTAVSPFQVWYSQDARPYTLLLLLSVLSFYCLLRMQRSSSKIWFLWFIFASAGMMYCHTVGVFVLFAEAIVVVLECKNKRGSLKRFSVAVCVLIVLGIPAALSFPENYSKASRIDRATSLASVPYGFYAFSVGFSLGPSVRSLHNFSFQKDVLPHLWALCSSAVIFGVLAMRGFVQLFRDKKRWLPTLALLGIPLLGVYMVSFFSKHTFNVRYAFPAFAAYVVVLGLGLASLRWRVALLAWVAVLAICGWSLNNHYFSKAYAKEDIAGAVNYIQEHQGENDQVAAAFDPRTVEFYTSKIGLESIEFFHGSNYFETNKTVKKLYDRSVDNSGRLWLIISRPFNFDSHGYVRDGVRKLFVISEQIDTFAGTEVWHCQPKI